MKFNKYSLCAVASGLMWGLSSVFPRILSRNGFAMTDVLIVSRAISAVLFALIVLKRDRTQFKVKPKELLYLIGLGLMGVMLCNYTYYEAMARMSIGVATVLEYTGPGWTVLMATLIFREKITRKKAVVVLMVFIGSALVSGLGKDSLITPLGFLFGIASGFFGGLNSIFLRASLNQRSDTFSVNFYGCLFAALSAMAVWGVSSPVAAVTASGSNFALALIYSIFGSVAPSMLYAYAITGVGAGSASLLCSSTPVIAVLMSCLMFREPMSLMSGIGVVIVLAALAFMNMPSKEKNEE